MHNCHNAVAASIIKKKRIDIFTSLSIFRHLSKKKNFRLEKYYVENPSSHLNRLYYIYIREQ